MPQEITELSELIVDEEFKALLPALDAEVFENLEMDILHNGVRDSIVIWNGIIIDGYNRYAICKKHDLPFTTVSMEFNSRDEVIDWMVWNQFIRRNLKSMELGHYRGVHYRVRKRIFENKSGKNQYSEDVYQNDTHPKMLSTAEELADKYKVSQITIKRNAKMSEAIDAIGEISPEARRRILSEEVKINKSKLEKLASASPEVLAEVVAQIEDGTYERRSGLPMMDSDAADSVSGANNMQPWEKEFGKMTNDFRKELRGLAKTDDTAAVRSALRLYIGMLEDLYKNI